MALLDGFLGVVVIDDELLIGGLGLSSLSGGLLDGSLGVSDELLILGDETFESGSLWVEGVLEMGRGDTESDLGVDESVLDLLFSFMMLGSRPSVFFLLRTHLEVEVSDKVLEGGDQFVHWAISFDL